MEYKLQVGDKVPAFAGKDALGNTISSQNLQGRPYVLYFYPQDDTPGCTLEACSFRDSQPQIKSFGAELIGISPDTSQSHSQFIQKYGLNFTLISDENHQICETFDVWKEKNSYGKKHMGVIRSTFIVDGQGFIRWIERPVQVEGHAVRVLQALEPLSPSRNQ